MKLPTNFLIEILGGTNVRFAGGGKQRMAGRAGLSLAASVLGISNNIAKVPRSVTVSDISALGVGFVRPEPMMPRTEFILYLPSQAGASIGIQCVVRWCRKERMGGFKIGADFLNIVEEQLVDSQTTDQPDQEPTANPSV